MNNYLSSKDDEETTLAKKYAPDLLNDRWIRLLSKNISQVFILISIYTLLCLLGGWSYIACFCIAWAYVFYSTIVLVNGLSHLSGKLGDGFFSSLF